MKKFTLVEAQTSSVSARSLVKTESLRPGEDLPLVVRPAGERVNLLEWAEVNLALIEKRLARHGAILFRGFDVGTVEEFENFAALTSNRLLDYVERSTPRRALWGKVYSSTEYPADQSIPLHSEMSYARTWPTKLWFYCVMAADRGGETPIADTRRVFHLIDPRVSERFAEKQVMYVRNYSERLGLSWQEAFQTDDPASVESYCRRALIDFQWLGANRLRTRQVCQAVARHPRSGEMVWFNQAHLFHVSNLPAHSREALCAEFAEEELPRQAFYGDGSPIESSALDEIRRAYEQAEVVFAWQAHDLLMLDNMLTAHGRRPYEGARTIAVAMADPHGA